MCGTLEDTFNFFDVGDCTASACQSDYAPSSLSHQATKDSFRRLLHPALQTRNEKNIIITAIIIIIMIIIIGEQVLAKAAAR